MSRRACIFGILFLLLLTALFSTCHADSAGIIPEQDFIQLPVGKTQKLTYQLTGTEEYGKQKKAVWETSDPSVAAVSNGNVKGVSEGRAEIILTVPFENGNELKASFSIQVYQPLKSIAFAEKKMNMNVGDLSEPVIPVIKPDNVTFGTVTLLSDDDTIVAIEDGNRLLALKAGKVNIRCMTDEPVPGKEKPKTAVMAVTVLQPVLSIEQEMKEIQVGIGKTVALDYTLLPEDVSNPKLEWHSGDEKIVSVSKGKITGRKVGTTTVTAAATDGSGITAEWHVTVFQPVKKIQPETQSITIEIGKTCDPVSCVVFPEDATYTDLIWSSRDEYAVKVNENGAIQALYLTDTVITAVSSEPVNPGERPASVDIKVHVVLPEIEPHSDDYVIKNGVLVEYTGSETHLVIPRGVIDISGWIFRENTSIVSVSIPDTVMHLGQGLFYKCSSLESVNIPDGIDKLEYQCFLGCESLKEIRLPAGLQEIEGNVFYGCSSLRSVIIPDGVTQIGSGAFSGCENLTELVIPDSVTEIGSYAFSGCRNLTSLHIPSELQEIEYETFFNCEKLESVTIPGTVSKIDTAAFASCKNLRHASFVNGISEIGDGAFLDCESLESLELPRTVKHIGDRAFSGCTSLTSVVLPEGLETVSTGAFADGPMNITMVTIPESVTEIAYDAFRPGEEFTIRGEAGSYAEYYAALKQVRFEAMTMITSLHRYSSPALIAMLKIIPDRMEAVTTKGSEDILQFRFADTDQEQVFSSFSEYLPNISLEDIRARISDIALSADRFVFRMYNFQNQRLKHYSLHRLIQVEQIQEWMPDAWTPFNYFDFAAGFAEDQDSSWYWMPVYYADDSQGIRNNMLCLYILWFRKGSDQDFLDRMRVFMPVEEDYRAEEFLLADRQEIAGFLKLMQDEYDYILASPDTSIYRTLRNGCSGGDVTDIQKQMFRLGYTDASIDGYYGDATEEAVLAWQEDHGMNATGEADPETQEVVIAQTEGKQLLSDWIAGHPTSEGVQNP